MHLQIKLQDCQQSDDEQAYAAWQLDCRGHKEVPVLPAAPHGLHMYWAPLNSATMVKQSPRWSLPVAAQQPTWTAEAWQGQASARTAVAGAHRPHTCWVVAAAQAQLLPCLWVGHAVWLPLGASPGGQASPAWPKVQR